MKISFGIIVIDGMPFIKHQLKLIYPYAHEIIICEGGDDIWEKSHGYRNSQDESIDVIQKFPDPENKIKIIQKKWKHKNQMCYEYSRRMTGDIVWHIDADEFVDPIHIPYLISLFKEYPAYDTMAIPQIVFWGDTRTIIGAQKDCRKWIYEWPNIGRVYRFKKGLYINHLPYSGYFDPKTQEIIPGKLFPEELFKNHGVYNYHFSYILPKAVQSKMNYYNERIPNCIKPDWYEDVFMKFTEKRDEWIRTCFDVQPVNPETKQNYPYRLKPLEKPLPSCLKNLEKDIYETALN